ncbi:MAG: formate/nitrite transporter family protein [Sneathiellales bacterium]|nr:formate/nitrite transporter family protein [Sneathiellales bacterium]
MTYYDSVVAFADLAAAKRENLRRNPAGFFILAMMAGAYVGLGILLIFSVGQNVDAALRPIVMGASFGIALILVVFAGSELYTGHTMYLTHGFLMKKTGFRDFFKCLLTSWVGNLAGAVLLAFLFVYGGGGIVLGSGESSFLHEVAYKKMHATSLQLFFNGILCNWLVCLALWCAARTENDFAKIGLIWFCLYAFIAAGFEHSVANMTIFAVALISEHPDTITLTGALRNLIFVSSGNAVAGVGAMGIGYWIAAGRPRAER